MKQGFQVEKKQVLTLFDAINAATTESIFDILSEQTSTDWVWRGFHPFGELKGAKAVAQSFWQPFIKSFRNLQRRQDIFFAGENEIDGYATTWVVSMGHLVGLFDHPFLGISPTGKMAFFRYCEFNRVENGKIVETSFYFDLPDLMIQAGLQPFKSQRGAQIVQPGPMMHNGLYFNDQPLEDGQKTQDAINAMITDLGTWKSGMKLEDELARTWHKDMIWWGPAGIGATYTIDRYAQQHSGPFRAAFSERSKTDHICRVAEGHFGGFFGWPNFTAVNSGGFLGTLPTDYPCEFRVIDLYRREGSKLAENWVFIDLLHWYYQQGIDLLQL